MTINSRTKGARGEREFAALCRAEGYEARRGQQFNGLDGEDVVGLPYVHPEVKRVEKLNLEAAMQQSIRDCQGKIPIVAHRKNGEKWKITMLASDWFRMYHEYEASEDMKGRGSDVDFQIRRGYLKCEDCKADYEDCKLDYCEKGRG